jgi:integrase
MANSSVRVTTSPDRRDLRLKRVVGALRPRADAFKVYDATLPGFGLRIAPTGHRGYFLSYRHRGVKHTMYLGDTRTLTPAQAHSLAKEASVAVAHGRDPLAERNQESVEGKASARARRDAPTLADIGERYLTSLSLTKSKKWAKEARRLFDAHIAPPLGARKVADVDTPDVRRLHEKLRKLPATANRTRAVVSAILSRAAEDGARPLGSNPCDGVQPYEEPPRERYLSAAEWKRLGEAIKAERAELANTPEHDTRPAQLDAIVLLAMTGGRREAVTRRRWSEMDWEARVIRITPAHKGASRLYLGESALAIVSAWSAERGARHPYLFPGQKRRTGARRARGEKDARPARDARPIASIRPVWESLCTRAKLRDLRPHDLRRSFATVAGDVGVSGHLIGGLLSHVVPGVTGIYAHRTDPALADAANKVSAEIAERLALDGVRDPSVIPLEVERERRRPQARTGRLAHLPAGADAEHV